MDLFDTVESIFSFFFLIGRHLQRVRARVRVRLSGCQAVRLWGALPQAARAERVQFCTMETHGKRHGDGRHRMVP